MLQHFISAIIFLQLQASLFFIHHALTHPRGGTEESVRQMGWLWSPLLFSCKQKCIFFPYTNRLIDMALHLELSYGGNVSPWFTGLVPENDFLAPQVKFLLWKHPVIQQVCRDTWPSSRWGSLKHRHKHISYCLSVVSALLWEPFKGSNSRWITVPWLKLLLETINYVAIRLELNYSHCWLIIWQFLTWRISCFELQNIRRQTENLSETNVAFFF